MKLYKTLFTLPLLLILVLSVFSGFRYGPERETVKRLLTERTTVLQQAYYDNTDEEEIERHLVRIETQPLLGEDILSLRETKNTDIDKVVHMEIMDIRQIKRLYSFHTYQIRICWYMNGAKGNYKEILNYHVVMKYDGKAYKIKEFDYINNM